MTEDIMKSENSDLMKRFQMRRLKNQRADFGKTL